MQGHIANAYELWANGQGTEAGQLIYDHLRSDERPAWAAGILRVVLDLVPGIPEAEAVMQAASEYDTWPRARELFYRVRQVTLRTTEQLPLNCLLLAENAAKVTYNATFSPASLSPASFDHDAGWAVVRCALAITQIIDDPSFTARLWRAIAQSPQDGGRAAARRG